MRPVNLIPADERRGAGAPSRAGLLPYALVAVLAVAVLAVSALTLVGKSVREKEAEVTTLEQREAELVARAQSLAAFSDFQAIKDARVATVAALAESRFDWERVMRELSLVLPSRVWLVNLTGTVSPGVGVANAAGIPIRQDAQGPALELVGCAHSHRDVAKLIAALENIDGVTRVGVASSDKPDSAPSGGGNRDKQTGDACQTRTHVAKFEIVAAFDEVPVPEGAAPPPAPEPGSETNPVADDGGVEETKRKRREGKENVQRASEKAGAATEIIPGVGE